MKIGQFVYQILTKCRFYCFEGGGTATFLDFSGNFEEQLLPVEMIMRSGNSHRGWFY